VNEQMLAMLEWASEHPAKWHKIGNLDATRKAAAELLAKRGVIEIWPQTGLYRLEPQK
jgi:hypothetical protein